MQSKKQPSQTQSISTIIAIDSSEEHYSGRNFDEDKT
jgi:hypothetical protein